MEILVLGPMEVRAHGDLYPVGGAKQRALLARLLLAHGRPVSVARLSDELSGDRSIRDPKHALQSRISRLRSSLPMLTVEQVSGGYRLDRRDIDTDLSRFEEHRHEGERLCAEGALLGAADRWRAALALWRGTAFAGTSSVPALEAEAARLDRLWAATLADRIDVDLALGREAEVIPELAAIIEENLLVERFWGQLMVALYRDGQVQEALRTYGRARDVFTQWHGVEPSGELGHLHLRILQDEPSHLLLRLAPVEHVSSTPPSPPVPAGGSAPAITSNDTDGLTALLQQRRSLVVTGPEGIGKTHVLRSVQAHLESRGVPAPFLSASALSQTIPLGVFAGVTDSLLDGWRTAPDVIDALARHGKRLVLLVDNANALDDSSLFVIRQLITTRRVPVLLAARSLTALPEELRTLYDSGDLTEVPIGPLGDDAADEFATAVTGGELTPDARVRIRSTAAGVPLRIREIITGSKAAGRLVPTDFGWELRGDPSPSPRLAQLTAERFDALDPDGVDALSLVAIAGEYPLAALDPSQRRALAHTDAVALSDSGWLRLRDLLDREVLRARYPDLRWHELTHHVVRVLTSELADANPQAAHRAHLLALDLGDPIDVPATVALAERALGAFDERLALRAAQVVISQAGDHVEAHRLAGIAASVLRMDDVAATHFEAAHRHAVSEAERTAVALAYARHFGLRRYDAKRALAIIDAALEHVTGAKEVQQLQTARMRWAAVAGMGGDVAPPPAMPADAADAMGLIVTGVSGVMTGPLLDAHRVLAQLHRVPREIVDQVPGGETLIALTEIMAVSYSGDLATAQQLLRERIERAQTEAPESLGEWEYALGFSELLSGDAAEAHALAVAAVGHLEWRDTSGLLPAAKALEAASAEVSGRVDTARVGFEFIPDAALTDPKVVMLQRWTAAWRLHRDGRSGDAATTLIETAQWLLAAQHSFFAAMCAHYAVRTGYQAEPALAILKDAHAVAGGGMLTLLVRHAEATVGADVSELDLIAREARALGLTATAADTWTALVDNAEPGTSAGSVHSQRAAIGHLCAQKPALVSWAT